MSISWALYGISFLFGTLVGSFLNVCIVRIPAGESVVSPRSHCRRCGRPVRAYDNIPLLSYLLLNGRCRDCGECISPQYFVVELLSGLLAMACLWKFHRIEISVLWFLGFIAPLLIISAIDLKHLIIPDKISIPFTLVGLFVRLVSEKFNHPMALLLDSFLGILLGAGMLLLVGKTYEWMQKREGIGLGDVKLAALIGAFLGWKAILVVFVLSSFLGSVVGIVLMIFFKRGLRSQIPFGPFLSLGALLFLFWGDRILTVYFHGVQRLFK